MLQRRTFIGTAIAALSALAVPAGKSKPEFKINPVGTVKGVCVKKPPADAFIPEEWARESLAILQENMVIGGLVHRDFDDEEAAMARVRKQRGLSV